MPPTAHKDFTIEMYNVRGLVKKEKQVLFWLETAIVITLIYVVAKKPKSIILIIISKLDSTS